MGIKKRIKGKSDMVECLDVPKLEAVELNIEGIEGDEPSREPLSQETKDWVLGKSSKRDQEIVMGLIGPRGAGKSVGLCYFSLVDMYANIELYSNMQIGVADEKGRLYEAKNLETSHLFAFGELLNNCTVSIDEFQFYALARESNTNRNKLIGWLGFQIRKKAMSFFYTVQRFELIDGWWRAQTDVLVKCSDLHYTSWGRENNVERGVWIHMQFYDMSGIVTGTEYADTRSPFGQMKLYAKELWPCYNSYALIGMDQVFQRYDIDRQTYIVGRRPYGSDGDGETQEMAPLDFSDIKQFVDEKAIIGGVVQQLREAGIGKIHAPDMWRKLGERGVQGDPRRLGALLRKEGLLVERKSNNQPVNYIIPDAAR